jgi:hypothetical protein
MNGADLARLELAKRAYRAAEPSATEVQRGVRRARLGLRRPKERRRWFGKGLVMVVLAVGGLAYAKPQAMGELVTSALEANRTPSKQLREGGNVSPQPMESPSPAPGGSSQVAAVAGPTVAPAVARPTLDEPALTAFPPAPKPEAPRASSRLEPAPRVAASSPAVPSAPLTTAASQAAPADDRAGETRSVSDWGRVGQALARGDENKALAALAELSESADQRTRDKADLGRAQLFMANGNRDGACALARALTNRRAGSRIERQAQALLKSCAR